MRLLTCSITIKILGILAFILAMPGQPFITIPNSTLDIALKSIITQQGDEYIRQPLMFYKTSHTTAKPALNGNIQTVDGDLLLIVDEHSDMAAHYYHIMEHLLGVWNFLTYNNTENVKLIILCFNHKLETEDTWQGKNQITYHLLTKIFPNAKIMVLSDLPQDLSITANNIHISSRYKELVKLNMNGPISYQYNPKRIRELRDLVFTKMGVVPSEPSDYLRITYVKRSGAKRTMDTELENQLLAAIAKETGYSVNVVDFSKMSFYEQLQTIANTDLLIGVHGNGLTHLIFLPDHATVLEYHSGEKTAFFRTLAQIRGVQYYGNYHMDWELKYNKSLRNFAQDANVTSLDINRTIALIRTLNSKYR